jgi:hypothetical protein
MVHGMTYDLFGVIRYDPLIYFEVHGEASKARVMQF